MFRKVYNGWRFISVLLALVLIFFVCHTFVPSAIFMISLNGLFFGVFVSVVSAYGRLLLKTFFGELAYNRTFHYTFSVMLQWIAMLAGRAVSVWMWMFDQANAINENIIVAAIAYVSIVALIWQTMVLTQEEEHDRNVLFFCMGLGAAVAAGLFFLQAWGSHEIVLGAFQASLLQVSESSHE